MGSFDLLTAMTITSSSGKVYEAALMEATVVLWRATATPAERREWPNGSVIRCVFLPNTERENLVCTCPAAKFQQGGADECPHGLPALRALAVGEEKGVQGLALAGPPRPKGLWRLAGNLSQELVPIGKQPFVPNSVPSLAQDLSHEDKPLDQLWDERAGETIFDFAGVAGDGL